MGPLTNTGPSCRRRHHIYCVNLHPYEQYNETGFVPNSEVGRFDVWYITEVKVYSLYKTIIT